MFADDGGECLYNSFYSFIPAQQTEGEEHFAFT
jgi:hypothetical protein